MGKLTESMIDKASHANLIAYCQSHGIELKKIGKEYVVKEHDSIYISSKEPWKWYRHSTDEGGKAIDFAVKFLGMPFRTAVFEMLGRLPEADTDIVPTTSYKPELANNQKRVIAYLCQKRKIEYGLVTKLIREGKLRQDTHGNCMFLIRDRNGRTVSAELHGTGDTRFKGQTSEQEGYGFEFPIGDTVKWVIYTESAIDLISLYQMYKEQLKDVLLVSMGGLKSVIIESYKKTYPEARHCLAVDNDERGNQFAHESYPDLTRKVPRSPFKDWNEQLVNQI